MNILYYCDEYPPARNGGIGTVVKLVAEDMARRGHQVTVAGKYWEGEGKTTVEQINGVTVIRWHKGTYNTLGIKSCDLFHLGDYRKRKAQRVLWRTHKLMEKLVGKCEVDIVEMPDYVDDFINNDGLETSQMRFSVPTVLRVHGSVSFLYCHAEGKMRPQKLAQDRGHFGRADAICAVSEFSKRFVTEHICPEKAVDVIYNPIESQWFEGLKEEKLSQTVLYFGKIAAMKGVFSLIKAFNIVAEKHPQARLRIVGSGDLEQAKSLVDSRFADRVEFVGFKPHAEIMDEIDEAAFCVLPSYSENFSMAALEVLARKKALVYTNRASGNELIDDGVDGLLVNPDDVGQIAEKMDSLLSDADLRHRLAEKGYEMCRQRFSTETIVPQLEQYYQNLIEKCRKQGS